VETAIVVFAVLLWASWNRWLQHKELAVLVEKGADAGPFLAATERARSRRLAIAGAVLLAAGIATSGVTSMMLWYLVEQTPDRSPHTGDVGGYAAGIGFGVFLALVGLAVLLARIAWARADRQKPEGQDKQDRE